MKIETITPHLNERYAGFLAKAVASLESGITAGVVRNVDFNDAKDTFNRVAEQAAEAFLKTGPHIEGRDGKYHHQSDWWLGAYDADAFVHGTRTLPTVLKRAEKHGLKEYAAFIAELLPLRELLEAAKPLIRKKGELPPTRTAKQIAEDAKRMHCQCCGRAILAETGVIAHHGYERPDYGWQTASCYGARELPFEVDRNALGAMIAILNNRRGAMIESKSKIAREKIPVVWHYREYIREKQDYVDKSVALTRASFAEHIELLRKYGGPRDFDTAKERDLAHRVAMIEAISRDIKMQQARYDGWKQTHERKNDEWVKL